MTAREGLENPVILRENNPVIAGLDWVMGAKQFGFGDYEQSIAKSAPSASAS